MSTPSDLTIATLSFALLWLQARLFQLRRQQRETAEAVQYLASVLLERRARP